MSDPTVLPRADAPTRHRWKRKLLVILVLLVAVPAGFYGYVSWRDRQALVEAIAEADRLDPGWRLDELAAKRQTIPDEENGAATVLTATMRMPRNWSSPTLDALLQKPMPEYSLDREQEWSVNTDLAAVAPAVTEARKLADRPRGRYLTPRAPVAIMTLMNHIQEARLVARLLQADALRRAQDEDLPGALASCRAALNVGRSIGDEPYLIAMLVRVACDGVALETLERVLAQGTVPTADLLAFQRLLEDEAAQPLQLIGLRGERAMLDDLFDAVQSGKMNGDELLTAFAVARTWAPTDALQMQLFLSDKGRRAKMLREQTRLVEINKLPAEERMAAARGLQLSSAFKDGPSLLAALADTPSAEKLTRSFVRWQARLRCGIALLAVERFRIERGRWPESLAEVCPAYLATVPLDPFDGQPLRFRRVADGVVLYSVGPKQKDTEGKLNRRGRTGGADAGATHGYQLWDVDKRRQSSGEPIAGPPRAEPGEE